MNRFLPTLLFFAFALCLSTSTFAQKRTSMASFAAGPTPAQKKSLHRATIGGQKKLALLLPAVQTVKAKANYRGPSLQKMATAYRTKCAYVNRLKGNVNTAQYKQLQADFARLNKDLDMYIRYHGGRSGSQFSDCYTVCHQSFPGIGGGAGANRFACKFGCFVEATGGRGN
ncbi:MAG: hypothetical protein AAF242_06745 [Bacteroidota bacterium]